MSPGIKIVAYGFRAISQLARCSSQISRKRSILESNHDHRQHLACRQQRLTHTDHAFIDVWCCDIKFWRPQELSFSSMTFNAFHRGLNANRVIHGSTTVEIWTSPFSISSIRMCQTVLPTEVRVPASYFFKEYQIMGDLDNLSSDPTNCSGKNLGVTIPVWKCWIWFSCPQPISRFWSDFKPHDWSPEFQVWARSEG